MTPDERKTFLLQKVQPGLIGLIDGTISTLAPIFATAYLASTHTAFLVGLASALGAAIARPDRLTVAALGDGGALMGASELETAARLGLNDLLIVVYNDEAYGAEVHHFGPHGDNLDNVQFPETDLAAIARGHGYAAATVRTEADLAPLKSWLAGPKDRPMLIDAKVTRSKPSWWLEGAFRGH